MSKAALAENTKTVGYALLPMVAEDLDQVVALERSCHLSVWGHDGYASELLRAEAVMLTAREVISGAINTNLLGFIAARLNIDELHINNIAIKPEWRCRRLGSALLTKALVEGQRLGAKWGVLEVRASNAAAQKLYIKHGFDVLGRRPDYYSAPTEDALIMGASL